MSIYGNNIDRVTEVIDTWHDGDGLINWAASLGHSWREVRGHAAKVGTHTHEIIEATLKHMRADGDLRDQMQIAAKSYVKLQNIPTGMLNEVSLACTGWMQWANGKSIVVERLEEKLVDEKRGFGGTCDFKGLIDGHRVMLDWKTSKGISVRHKIQLGAYAMLHEMHHPDEPIEWYGVVQCDKRMGVYKDMYWNDLEMEKEMFLTLLKVKKLGGILKL